MTNPARDEFQRALKAAPKLPRGVRLVNIRRRQGRVTLFWEVVRGNKRSQLTTQSFQHPNDITPRRGVR